MAGSARMDSVLEYCLRPGADDWQLPSLLVNSKFHGFVLCAVPRPLLCRLYPQMVLLHVFSTSADADFSEITMLRARWIGVLNGCAWRGHAPNHGARDIIWLRSMHAMHTMSSMAFAASDIWYAQACAFYVSLLLYKYVCIRMFVRTYIHTYNWFVYIHIIHMYAFVHVYILYTYIYIYIHIHIHTYTYIHTQAYIRAIHMPTYEIWVRMYLVKCVYHDNRQDHEHDPAVGEPREEHARVRVVQARRVGMPVKIPPGWRYLEACA
jgi:hypothetical protein